MFNPPLITRLVEVLKLFENTEPLPKLPSLATKLLHTRLRYLIGEMGNQLNLKNIYTATDEQSYLWGRTILSCDLLMISFIYAPKQRKIAIFLKRPNGSIDLCNSVYQFEFTEIITTPFKFVNAVINSIDQAMYLKVQEKEKKIISIDRALEKRERQEPHKSVNNKVLFPDKEGIGFWSRLLQWKSN